MGRAAVIASKIKPRGGGGRGGEWRCLGTREEKMIRWVLNRVETLGKDRVLEKWKEIGGRGVDRGRED